MQLAIVTAKAGAVTGYTPRPLDKLEEDICNAWSEVAIVYAALSAWTTNKVGAAKVNDAWDLMAKCRKRGLSPIASCNEIRIRIFGETNVD